MKTLIIVLSLLFTRGLAAQDMAKFRLYNPQENAEKALEKVIDRAEDNKKHVFVQVGGNWCVWCARFNDFVTSDQSIDSAIRANFEVYHLNYSPDNRNNELMKRYKFPQRFGFPVFLILDSEGDLIHTQSSWYLESGKSYDKEKVLAFFNDWSPRALDPAQYKDDQ